MTITSTRKAWKRTEREVAEALGGKRVPVTGRSRGDAPDIAHDWLAVEVKHRRTIPEWLHNAVSQARACARGHQLPIVVLHQLGERHADDLVVMRLQDFTENFGSAGLEAKE